MSKKFTKVVVKNTYSLRADELWPFMVFYPTMFNPVTNKGCYQGLPAAEVCEGESISLRMRFYGWLPAIDWTLLIAERNDHARRIVSAQQSGQVRYWKHTMEVEEYGPDRSRIIDQIVMDAGVLTPVLARWAKGFYGSRNQHAIALPQFAPQVGAQHALRPV